MLYYSLSGVPHVYCVILWSSSPLLALLSSPPPPLPSPLQKYLADTGFNPSGIRRQGSILSLSGLSQASSSSFKVSRVASYHHSKPQIPEIVRTIYFNPLSPTYGSKGVNCVCILCPDCLLGAFILALVVPEALMACAANWMVGGAPSPSLRTHPPRWSGDGMMLGESLVPRLAMWRSVWQVAVRSQSVGMAMSNISTLWHSQMHSSNSECHTISRMLTLCNQDLPD